MAIPRIEGRSRAQELWAEYQLRQEALDAPLGKGAIQLPPVEKGWKKEDSIVSFETPQVSQLPVETLQVKKDTLSSGKEDQVLQMQQMLCTASPKKAPEIEKKNVSVEPKKSEGILDKMEDFGRWTWSKIFGSPSTEQKDAPKSDDIDKANPIERKREWLSKQEIKERKEYLEKFAKLINLMKEDISEAQLEYCMEALRFTVRQVNEEIRDDEQKLNVEKMIQNYDAQKLEAKEKRRLAEELIKEMQSNKFWGNFEKVASAVGGIAMGLGLTLTTGWGLPALVLAVGNAVNTFFNNPLEAAISKGVTDLGVRFGGWKDDERTRRETFEKTKLATGAVTAIASIAAGIGMWGKTVEGVMHLASAALQGVQGIAGVKGAVTHYKSEKKQGEFFEIGEKYKASLGKSNASAEQMGKTQKKKLEEAKGLAKAEEETNEIKLAIIRGIA